MLTREDRRQRFLAHTYAHYAQIVTGGYHGQNTDRRKMLSLDYPLLAGNLDAPEFMPAGAMSKCWQQECRRGW